MQAFLLSLALIPFTNKKETQLPLKLLFRCLCRGIVAVTELSFNTVLLVLVGKPHALKPQQGGWSQDISIWCQTIQTHVLPWRALTIPTITSSPNFGFLWFASIYSSRRELMQESLNQCNSKNIISSHVPWVTFQIPWATLQQILPALLL